MDQWTQCDFIQTSIVWADAACSVSPTPSPGGVGGGKRRPVLRLSDVKNREDIGDFLRKQLNLRHPDSVFEAPQVDRVAEEKARKALAKQERREAEMRRKAADAAARFDKSRAINDQQNEQQIVIQNDNMKILIMLGSAV